MIAAGKTPSPPAQWPATCGANLRREFSNLLARARTRTIRSMRQWTEEEVIIPEGRYQDQRWRPHRQPYGARLLDAIDSGRYPRVAVTGCVQSGKSLHGFVLPILYHLFEIGEPVILGAPTIEVAKDKWRLEVEPVFRRTRYWHLRPTRGPGSQNGFAELVQFRNGAALKAMSGQGGDETRSSFTSRVVVVTEADKMDEAATTSRESNPLKQLEARTESYDLLDRRFYLECTVSVPGGAIWQNYQDSTRSRLVSTCVHCGDTVIPDRDELRGWKECTSVRAVLRQTRFHCPACQAPYSEADRRQMVQDCHLVHDGQRLEGGQVIGPEPDTLTLGFRWTAWHNLFWSAAAIGRGEWEAERAEDEDDAAKYQTQFVWCQPWTPPDVEIVKLDAQAAARRVGATRRGLVPDGLPWLTLGVDVGEYRHHWVATAWSDDARGQVVDYGHEELDRTRDLDISIKAGLLDLIHRLGTFPSEAGPAIAPHQIWIDAGHKGDLVRQVCRELTNSIGSGVAYPVFGRGHGQHHFRRYGEQTKTGNVVRAIGLRYHFKYEPDNAQLVVELDSDHWKSWSIRRLNADPAGPASVVLFDAQPHEHRTFVRHLTAEEETRDLDKQRNLEITKWIRKRKNNHYFDAYSYSCAAAHWCGVRVVKQAAEPEPEAPPPPTTPPADQLPQNWQGRPFFVSDRPD